MFITSTKKRDGTNLKSNKMFLRTELRGGGKSSELMLTMNTTIRAIFYGIIKGYLLRKIFRLSKFCIFASFLFIYKEKREKMPVGDSIFKILLFPFLFSPVDDA